jgi:hypothetical protein
MSDATTLLAQVEAEREIGRSLLTYCRGIDRRDSELLRSVYHDDAIDDHGGAFIGGPDEYVAWVMPHLLHFTSTMHTLHNVLIDADVKAGAARVESYCVAHHVRPGGDGEPIMDVFACRYVDRFEHRPGASWRIAHRVVVKEWRLRQPVLSDAEQRGGFLTGSRDRTDVSYAVELPRRDAVVS